MQSRADEIRKRMAKRRKMHGTSSMKDKPLFWAQDEERYGFDRISSYEAGPDEGNHPLFNKELFVFKILGAICLFLIVAILFKNESATFNQARHLVQNTMEDDFQFATVSNWYEKQFGKPLALLPFMEDKGKKTLDSGNDPQYALPASGRIIEDFAKNGQGIVIETGKDATVKALNEGIVRFAGVKEGFGKTVIIQHADNTETWYGNLATIDVTLWTFIEKGTKLGLATSSPDGMKSSFNLAVKKENDFIDPIQVIQFE
ncbi:peptidoglycan DD-metalloendopeptidase family protein [Neobacillus sp. D3-1R]|uniref:peptidoglycan DD-metalloendopeptidase family protein n=1 Tax=Neobacillus sp. D3-1R TaxID=3445778 RepID=UPI003FA07D65